MSRMGATPYTLLYPRQDFLLLLILTFFALFSLSLADLCSLSNPCPTGCCSKFGYCGFGPDFCGQEICAAFCDRKADCRHSSWPSGFSSKDACPLNVCCSKHGFCGTTSDFCGDSVVQRPQCDSKSTSSMARVVGYFETWGPRRPCHAFKPEQIPVGVYTHINIAFATIDPATFQVRPSHTDDVDLYQRIAQAKRFDPDLRIYIAIGGWAFNDPGPTRNVFSDLAKSLVNQRAFFKSLTTFLSVFDFDGTSGAAIRTLVYKP
jgi:chitinase